MVLCGVAPSLIRARCPQQLLLHIKAKRCPACYAHTLPAASLVQLIPSQAQGATVHKAPGRQLEQVLTYTTTIGRTCLS